ncbi:MAG: glycosyltransferase [Cyanobacteria bacterium P01_G01_bin.4]
MSRILILYASLGGGHVSAAQALCDAFSRHSDIEVECEDALAHSSSIYRGVVRNAYEQLSEKVPILYKAFYDGSNVDDLEQSLENNKTWAKLERPFFKKLGEVVRQSKPDAIVCVQQIPSRLLQLLDRDDEVSSIPQYVVVTDAVVHSTWINRGVRGYFLPNDISRRMLVQRGIDGDKLHVNGIPIDLSILQPKTKHGARRQLDLPINRPLISVFGGGLNPKRINLMVADLLESPNPAHIVVAAGRNNDLLDAMENLEGNSTVQLQKVGVIDYVDDLVVASDLAITKAGGLITSEILARGTPMVIVDPIPGQEEENADVIAAAGAGVQIRLPEMVAPAVRFLLRHPSRLEEMHQWALELGKPRAALDIAESIANDLNSIQDASTQDALNGASAEAVTCTAQ